MLTTTEHYLVITALGADRPGIVNTITHHVSQCGCNIEDSRLALLGQEFTFIMLLSGSWNAIAQIESTLPQKGMELDLLIVMKRTRAEQHPARPTTVRVQVDVKDAPQIIERFTALFDQYNLHIAELSSKTRLVKESPHLQLNIQIAAHSASINNASVIETEFYKLCTALNAQGNISIVNYPQNKQ